MPLEYEESQSCEYCGQVIYQNEDGKCYHAACAGDLSDNCGEIISGVPVDPESCPCR